jgi:HSP20 family protein
MGWDRKRKASEDWFSHVEKMMEDMADEFMDAEDMDRPLVYGFTLKRGEDGNPLLEEFGNVKREDGKTIITESREPLIDVVMEEDQVIITAELPGVQKEDVKVRSPDKHTVIISVQGQNAFYKNIHFDETLRPGTAKAQFKNGVLEVKIVYLPNKDEKEIQIE